MSEKKRKRGEENLSEHPNKRVATAAPAEIVEVSVVQETGEWAPILASTPGLSLPSTVSFKPYKKSKSDSREHPTAHSKLLLHSSGHPTIDYTAQEESGSQEGLLNHYIGIYDPENGKLKLVPARPVTVRRTLRQDAANEVKKEKETVSSIPLSARSALGLAFGTKKSQKAIRSLTANDIRGSAGKSGQGPVPNAKLDAAASYVLETMAASVTSIPTREDMQNEVNQAKPIPKPNMNAETPAEVYPIERLVGTVVWKHLDVKQWKDKVEAGEEITTKSRFVSGRVNQVVKKGDEKLLQALKYLLLLLEWYSCLHNKSKGGKKVPSRQDVTRAIEWASDDLLDNLSERFAEGSHLNKWHTQNLQTHICALSLTIDNFATDIHDLSADLHLNHKALSQLFTELGCKVSVPTESERTKRNLKQKEATTHRIAKLKIPLRFPKLKAVVARRGRRGGRGGMGGGGR